MNRDVCQHGAPLIQGCARCDRWWPADQDPAAAGLYVVRDGKGNVEVATWLCDWNGQNGGWTRELHDVDRDDIIAWMRVPEYAPC